MLEGKTIVVTGTLQGIGKETVKVLADNHANVIACAYKEESDFEKYCQKVAEQNNVRIHPVYFDMSDNDSIRNAAREIQKLKVDIHGLINIAGINRDAYFNMITWQDMADTFQVNFFSQIIFSQYIVKLMQRKKINGSIVFTSSVTAMDGNEGQVVYGASKAALIGACRSMALELGKTGIRVNCIAPGVIRSPMTDQLDAKIIDEKIKRMEIPRLGEANEVANMYMFLMSDFSSHISGQVIRVDGGM